MKSKQTSKRNPITPMLPRASQYGIAPELVKKRLAEYPEMTSLLVKDLFTDTPAVIYPSETGIPAVRKAAEEALSRVDMSMIKPGQSVNVCASHHGFTLLGGEPYAELLRAVRDVIAARTGTQNIRLRAGVGLRFRETEEYIKRYRLDEHYKGKARGVAPIDEGVAIRDGDRHPVRHQGDLRRRLDRSRAQQRRARGALPPSGRSRRQAVRHVLCPHRDPFHLSLEHGTTGRQLHRPSHLRLRVREEQVRLHRFPQYVPERRGRGGARKTIFTL